MLSLDGAACLFALLHEAPVGTQQPHQLNDSENSGRRTKNTATVPEAALGAPGVGRTVRELETALARPAATAREGRSTADQRDERARQSRIRFQGIARRAGKFRIISAVALPRVLSSANPDRARPSPSVGRLDVQLERGRAREAAGESRRRGRGETRISANDAQWPNYLGAKASARDRLGGRVAGPSAAPRGGSRA